MNEQAKFGHPAQGDEQQQEAAALLLHQQQQQYSNTKSNSSSGSTLHAYITDFSIAQRTPHSSSYILGLYNRIKCLPSLIPPSDIAIF